jgi:exopolysaccharide biosynthesis polyprenyl glycosylphosphotransferase
MPQDRRRLILVGDPAETARLRSELHSKEPVEVAAELDLARTPVSRLLELLHEHSINGVVVSANRSFFDQVEAAIRACELEGVEVWLVADFFKTHLSRTSLDDFYGRPMLVFRTTPEASWQGVLKQVVDFTGALCFLLFLALPLALIALLVKITSPGPIFFRQQRSGINGRPFTIYKFRTMVTNAEQLKHELAAMNEMTGPVFKVTNDPRVTPIGKFLRKFSLDEFPQLFNVLRGEMSLVGPRPLPVDEVKRFHDLAHRRRLSVKPGLTCLWQISGRNNVKDFKDWVRLDLEYIDNWSLWLDFKILLRTVPVVMVGTGAK